MTDFVDWDDSDQDDNPNPTTPKALRDAYERQKKENTELAKQMKELSTKFRTAEVKQRFAAKGLPEKAVDLFPKDVDPTDESINQWAEQYGSLFGSTSTATAETSTEVTPQDRQEDLQVIMADQFDRMNKVSQSAPSSGPKNDLATMLANPNLVDEVPYEDFLAAMRQAGAKV
jgi:hypothetical protein